MADQPDAPAEKPQSEMDKSDLVTVVMQKPHSIPSYEAWAMTVPELRAIVKEADGA